MTLLKRKVKLDDEEPDKPSRTKENQEETVEKEKFKLSFTSILIVVASALLFSLLLIFLFDWTGWKSNLRDKMTDVLLGKEKEILIARYEKEYQAKLKEAKDTIFAKERGILVLEYEELAKKKDDYNKDLKKLENEKNILEVYKEELALREEELDQIANQYQSNLIEIQELSKIYQAMDPKNAALLLSAIDDDIQIIQILKLMKTDKIATILELMETQKATDILSKLN